MKKTWVSALGFIVLMVTAVAWAAPVPDTGQTKCYTNAVEIPCPSSGQPFYGQDANYNINPMSYTKLDGSGNALPDSATSWVTVKDNVTGLVWEMKTSKDGKRDYGNPRDADNTYTWYDSNPATNGGNAGTPGSGTDTEDFIKALNDARYGGYSDWRMPTIKELAYIVNRSITYPGPTIDTGYFTDTAASWYWSSTTYVHGTGYAWGVNFGSGGVYGSYKYYGGYVRAVRGGQSWALGDSVIGSFDAVNSRLSNGVSTATGGYTDNANGTVTDTSTGLTWQKASSSGKGWEQALAYCEGLNLGGYTDWRLPTVKELQGLADYSQYNPAINTTYFPDTAASWYWSSTTNVSDTNYAWLVDFDNGYVSYNYKDYAGYVRAVRGGQSGLFANLVISPVSREVTKDADATTFSVSNTGTGTMPWSASVISGSWLTITSGDSGTDAGTINCSFTANTSVSSRTATIRVTATGATGSPADVTVTQAPTSAQPVLSVTPSNQAVAKDADATTFSVSNTGTGTMPWSASVISGSWLTITSGASGTDAGMIDCSFTANTSASSRTATIRVTATGATGSPADVTVTQAPTSAQPVVSVSPANWDVGKDAGCKTFSVSNTGTGTMPWSASVISGSWLTITSGASGTDAGMIDCSFTANTSASSRTATIRVTATGATGSPADVTVTQAPTSAQPVVSVSPANWDVGKDAGCKTFSVSNTGTGTMPWSASVLSGSWLTITSGASGTDAGTINFCFTANTSTSTRTATIRVTATGATGSPVDVTVTQAPTPAQPVLSVTPSNQAVAKDAGTTTFSVSNTGTGTMPWSASVISGGSWLTITSGTSGTDSGTINCSFTASPSITSTSPRTAVVRVTATGATGSPVDVTVT
jgi:hypothetical protein